MKKEKGFTLIELLVVIAIIGILAAIAIPQFAEYKTRAFNGRAQSDLRNGLTAEEAYFVDNERYADCGSADCGTVLPGFVLSGDVFITFAAADGAGTADEFSAASCHARGDRLYEWASAGDPATANVMQNEPVNACAADPAAPGIA